MKSKPELKENLQPLLTECLRPTEERLCSRKRRERNMLLSPGIGEEGEKKKGRRSVERD